MSVSMISTDKPFPDLVYSTALEGQFQVTISLNMHAVNGKTAGWNKQCS
jgi:hypothetical protein